MPFRWAWGPVIYRKVGLMYSPWSTIAAESPRSFMRWSMSRFTRDSLCPEENGLVREKPRRDEEHDGRHRRAHADRDERVDRHHRVGQDFPLEQRRVQDRDRKSPDRRRSELPKAPQAEKDRGHVDVGRVGLTFAHAPREAADRDEGGSQEYRGWKHRQENEERLVGPDRELHRLGRERGHEPRDHGEVEPEPENADKAGRQRRADHRHALAEHQLAARGRGREKGLQRASLLFP